MPSALESVKFSFIRILAGLQHGVFVLALEDPVCHRVHCDVVRGRKRQKNGGAPAMVGRTKPSEGSERWLDLSAGWGRIAAPQGCLGEDQLAG